MTTWKDLAETKNNKLTIEIPDFLNNKKVEVTVKAVKKTSPKKKVVKKKVTVKKPRYDFSDLIAKWDWKGNALAEQHKLRNEWQ